MTELRELTDRVELNPDAATPPFELYLDLPADWSLLDTNPATWERSADTMLRTTFRASRLSAKERKEILGFFEQLVSDCQQAGAALSLLLVGRLSEGKAASLGMHFAFADGDDPASIGRLRDSLPRNGTTVEIESGVGPALLKTERMTMVPPGATELVALTSLQIFIPIPGTTWTLAIASASAYPELTEPLEELMRSIAGSFRADTPGATGDADPASGGDDADGDGPGNGGDTAGSDEEAFTALPTAKGPGIERGFRTMIRKQLGDRVAGSDDAENNPRGTSGEDS